MERNFVIIDDLQNDELETLELREKLMDWFREFLGKVMELNGYH